MELPPRIELGIAPYHGAVIPLNYRSKSEYLLDPLNLLPNYTQKRELIQYFTRDLIFGLG